jgi:serine/threonine-protein kinase
MLPPMNPDDGSYGYDDRPDRRRQKKSNTSTILLVVAGILVLVGAILIGKWAFGDNGANDSSFAAPNFVGQPKDDARQMAENVELKVTFSSKACENQKTGNICSQNPQPKAQVNKGDTVNLVVSTGAPKVAVPNVIDDPLADAKDTLEADKYQFQVETQTKESSQEPGTVLAQDPDPGKEVEKGSTITLTIAKEKKQSTVPDVTGKTCDEAKQQMQDNDLVGSCTEVETGDQSKVGKVIQTTPAANSTADPNSTVTIQIGKAAEKQKVSVPNLAGQRLKDAKKALQDAGLQVGNINGSQDDNAFVIVSDPAGGTQVDQGSAVNLQTTGQAGDNGGNGNGGIFGGVTGTAARTED